MSSNTISNTCANCGKGEESSINLKSCTACKLVKYCNRECQIAHRPQHKKECKKRAKELHDEALFTHPPPEEDCPICFLRMPSFGSGQVYMSCCGKVICQGCIHVADLRDEKSNRVCPFCRTRAPTSEKEMVERYKKRMDLNDATAIYNIGFFYADGIFGYHQNMAKALELWHRAGELDYSRAYYNIGNAYNTGIGVVVDKKKAWNYFELAAMGGNVKARHNLGALDQNKGNLDRALKHYMIAIEGGNKMSLENIKQLYEFKQAAKDDYTKALRLYQAYLDEVKCDHRDEAAAFNADWKYY